LNGIKGASTGGLCLAHALEGEAECKVERMMGKVNRNKREKGVQGKRGWEGVSKEYGFGLLLGYRYSRAKGKEMEV